MHTSLRRLASVLVLGCLVGCEQQEAVPLARSIPVAVALALAAIVALPVAWMGLDQLARRRRAKPRAEVAVAAPGLVAGLLFVTGALAIVPAVLALRVVAVGYRTPIVDVWSWEDVVWMTLFAEGLGLILLLLQWRAAWLVWRRRWWGAVIAVSEGVALVFGGVVAAFLQPGENLGVSLAVAAAGLAFVAASWPVRMERRRLRLADVDRLRSSTP